MPGAAHGDLAVHHHIGPARQLERAKGILFHQKHSQALLAVEFADGIENLLTIMGARPSEGSSSRRSLGRAIRARADGQHLLFATRKRAATLRDAFLQAREKREHFFQVFGEVLQAVEVGAHLQVFEHRHARKNAAAFR